MGWCHTATAGRTLERIEAACEKTREGTNERSSNVFLANGRRYFYEVTRRDQQDGGVCGSIHLCWDDERGAWAKPVGTFRIDGRGRVVRGPRLFKNAEGEA